VVVPKTIDDEEYPTIDYGYTTFHIDAGAQHLDGETALKYVRTRHGDNDFERSRRQQQVLLAIKDKIVENKLLATVRVLDFLNVLSDYVEHDIPISNVPDLVALASRANINDIHQLVLDTNYGRVNANSPFGWIILPNRDRIRPVVDQMFAGDEQIAVPEVDVEALARQKAQQEAELARQQVRSDYQAQAEELRQKLSGEGARLAVYNGTSDPLLAARAADWLQRQGYQVVKFGEASRTDYPRTVLLTSRELPFTISNLRDTFAIAAGNIRVADHADVDVDLSLIIGRDFYLLVSN